MFEVTVNSPDKRTNVEVTEDSTIAEILASQGINHTQAKASVMLDGTTLTNDALHQTLKDIGAFPGSTIAVCVKLQNA